MTSKGESSVVTLAKVHSSLAYLDLVACFSGCSWPHGKVSNAGCPNTAAEG